MQSHRYNEADTRAMIMQDEVELHPDLHSRGMQYDHTHPQRIFITGATGFLGAYLLSELLNRTQAEVYCLVRANNIELGREKLLENLSKYELDAIPSASRIHPVLGDLSLPGMGIDSETYDTLTKSIDTIYHSGAIVFYFRPYSSLKQVNVEGTHEVIRFASANRLKAIHYVSSYSVVHCEDYAGKDFIHEEPLSGIGTGFVLGYVQSKWVAERLCTLASERGIPTAIYRPGIISGDSRSGAVHNKDFIYKSIQTCLKLGKTPESKTWVHLTPVDYCAQAIVEISLKRESIGGYFHLTNPKPMRWDELMRWFASQGCEIDWLSPNEWWIHLSKTITADNFLAPVFMLDSGIRERAKNWQRWSIMDKEFSTENTQRLLSGKDIQCPPIDDKLLDLYFRDYIPSTSTS